LHPDARIPVVRGVLADLRPGDLLVTAPDQLTRVPAFPHLVLPAVHATGCSCCLGRDPWAEALAGQFVAMVKGFLPRFDRVILLAEASVAERVLNLLVEDRILAARYRAG
jgi:hypothetical protein